MLTTSEISAKNILKEYGIEDVQSLTDLNLKTLIQARGAFYQEENLEGKDGRIVTHAGRSIITISDKIDDKGKKRFTAAHELGHFELHKDLPVIADTQYELCNWYKSGDHEQQANEFASELLLPTKMFGEECQGKKFGQHLLIDLSDKFIVSRTAAILKFVKAGNHPVAVFCVQSNKVKWWKMSKTMEDTEHPFIESWAKYRVKVSKNLPPAPDSVAGQIFKAARFNSAERTQRIEKSTWFLTSNGDDIPMYEFCHFIPSYNFALSVVWED